jgi:hypothetical protein
MKPEVTSRHLILGSHFCIDLYYSMLVFCVSALATFLTGSVLQPQSDKYHTDFVYQHELLLLISYKINSKYTITVTGRIFSGNFSLKYLEAILLLQLYKLKNSFKCQFCQEHSLDLSRSFICFKVGRQVTIKYFLPKIICIAHFKKCVFSQQSEILIILTDSDCLPIRQNRPDADIIGQSVMSAKQFDYCNKYLKLFQISPSYPGVSL